MCELDGLSKKIMSVASCAEGNAVDDNGSATSASGSSAISNSRQSALDEKEPKIAIFESESSLNARESSIAIHHIRIPSSIDLGGQKKGSIKLLGMMANHSLRLLSILLPIVIPHLTGVLAD